MLDDYDYSPWFKELDDEPSMPPLDGDEEEVKGLTPNKLLTRLPVLLTQIKAGNNSYKVKSKTRQILYLFHPQNNITKTFYNTLIKPL